MVSKAVLAFEPMSWMEDKQTMTIKASMTAYSTAVGPSSETMNFLTPATNEFNMTALSFKVDDGSEPIPRNLSTSLRTKNVRIRLPLVDQQCAVAATKSARLAMDLDIRTRHNSKPEWAEPRHSQLVNTIEYAHYWLEDDAVNFDCVAELSAVSGNPRHQKLRSWKSGVKSQH